MLLFEIRVYFKESREISRENRRNDTPYLNRYDIKENIRFLDHNLYI